MSGAAVRGLPGKEKSAIVRRVPTRQGDPPIRVVRVDLHEIGLRPLPPCPISWPRIERDTRTQDLNARLILRLDLLEGQRRLVEHVQVEIAARGEDVLSPVQLHGIGGNCRRTMRLFVAIHVVSKKTPAVTSIMSEPKL